MTIHSRYLIMLVVSLMAPFHAVQAESEGQHQEWKLFGRVEDTSNKNNSEYIKLFPGAVIQREMLGLRFDFYKNHALTLELSNIETQPEDFSQAWLQWSAVLP